MIIHTVQTPSISPRLFGRCTLKIYLPFTIYHVETHSSDTDRQTDRQTRTLIHEWNYLLDDMVAMTKRITKLIPPYQTTRRFRVTWLHVDWSITLNNQAHKEEPRRKQQKWLSVEFILYCTGNAYCKWKLVNTHTCFDCTALGPTVILRALTCLGKGPKTGGFSRVLDVVGIISIFMY